MFFFDFERCENNSNVNTVIFCEQFLEFPTKYDGWESNIGCEENGLYPVLFDVRILDTLITFRLYAYMMVNDTEVYPHICEKGNELRFWHDIV